VSIRTPGSGPDECAAATKHQIRTTHRYGYRCGEWADLLTVAPAPDKRDCYVVRFEDGATDYWVVNDIDGRYELSRMSSMTSWSPSVRVHIWSCSLVKDASAGMYGAMRSCLTWN
jgi:hypothetical protein